MFDKKCTLSINAVLELVLSEPDNLMYHKRPCMTKKFIWLLRKSFGFLMESYVEDTMVLIWSWKIIDKTYNQRLDAIVAVFFELAQFVQKIPDVVHTESSLCVLIPITSRKRFSCLHLVFCRLLRGVDVLALVCTYEFVFRQTVSFFWGKE